jgi:hypothetical protein
LGAFRIKPESYHEDRVALAKEHGITEFDFYVMNPNSSAESVAYVGQDTACAADGRTWFRVYRYNLEKVLGSEVYIS